MIASFKLFPCLLKVERLHFILSLYSSTDIQYLEACLIDLSLAFFFSDSKNCSVSYVSRIDYLFARRWDSSHFRSAFCLVRFRFSMSCLSFSHYCYWYSFLARSAHFYQLSRSFSQFNLHFCSCSSLYKVLLSFFILILEYKVWNYSSQGSTDILLELNKRDAVFGRLRTWLLIDLSSSSSSANAMIIWIELILFVAWYSSSRVGLEALFSRGKISRGEILRTESMKCNPYGKESIVEKFSMFLMIDERVCLSTSIFVN